jgi:hypothetical protein
MPDNINSLPNHIPQSLNEEAISPLGETAGQAAQTFLQILAGKRDEFPEDRCGSGGDNRDDCDAL